MKRLAPFAVTLAALLIGWGVTLHGDSGIGWSLIVQQSGSTKGAATTFNCSTGLTCSLSAGVVTATAAAGGVSYGTYASLPVSSSTGQMYMQTDGPYSFVANGSGGWQPFVPGSNGGAVTLPVASGYSWSNQPTGATVSATSGGEILTVVGAGGDHFATRKVEAVPSAPWSLQAAYQMSPWSPNYTNSGIMAYNASTGKGIVCGIGAGSGRALQFQHLTNYTTVASNPFSGGYQSGTLQWIKMVNDATNIKCYESTTGGATWNLYYSETLATYYTGSSVDTVGYTMDINISTVSATLWLLHWLQGTT